MLFRHERKSYERQSALKGKNKMCIRDRIKYANVVVCSNRPANNYGMSIEEIKYAIAIGKPVVAVKITDSTSSQISNMGIDVIPYRKDSLEVWIRLHI